MRSIFAAALRARGPAITDQVLATGGQEYDFGNALDGEDTFAGNIDEHIDFLLAALEFQRPALFADYTSWLRTVASCDATLSHVVASYQALRDSVLELSGMEESEQAAAILDDAIRHLTSAASPPPPPVAGITGDEETAKLSRRYLELLIAAKRNEATRLVLSAIEDGLPVEDLYLNVLQPALREIGRLWQVRAVSVAQEHYVSAATQIVIARVYSRLPNPPCDGKLLLAGCANLNLHDIGLRCTCDIFELRGWNTHYLGASMPSKDFHQAVLQRKPDIVGISASRAPHLHATAEFIRRMRAAAETRSIPVMVGGVVFLSHADLWKQVGADGFAHDALSAVEIAQKLVEPS